MARETLDEPAYFQERVAGTPLAALFVGRDRDASFLAGRGLAVHRDEPALTVFARGATLASCRRRRLGWHQAC